MAGVGGSAYSAAGFYQREGIDAGALIRSPSAYAAMLTVTVSAVGSRVPRAAFVALAGVCSATR